MNWRIRTLVSAGLALIIPVGTGFSQDQEEAAPKEVTIERSALVLKDPDRYRVPLQLRPVQTVALAAPADGVVNSLHVELGKPVKAQGEVVRLRSEERQLQQRQAEAALEAARLELDAASSADKGAAAARVTVAQRALELAEYRVGQTIIRSPLDGQVAEILVSPGAYVRAGQTLARVYDPKKLVVELPVERNSVQAGEPIEVMVEDRQVRGRVETLLPATESFDPLRDLFVSVALARVVFDNGGGGLHPGQAVFSRMIPRHPVAEVPTSAVKNADTEESERKVQVLRDGFVRDLPIQLLGQVGATHVFVSARFAAGDELVVTSSEELAEGTWIRPLLQEPAEVKKPGTPTQPRPQTPSRF